MFAGSNKCLDHRQNLIPLAAAATAKEIKFKKKYKAKTKDISNSNNELEHFSFKNPYIGVTSYSE